MASRMSDESDTLAGAQSIEDTLRGELAQGDVILSTAWPILRHLLANDDHALFSDEVIARIRGMMSHLSRQLLSELAAELGKDDREGFLGKHQDTLAAELLNGIAFLGHAHALSIEAQLAERLSLRSGIDPVLTPLLQEQAASGDDALAGAAMRVIAAQARFMQHQRRMELPLNELPAELFNAATSALKAVLVDYPRETAIVAKRLHEGFDEKERRVGQMTRLLIALGGSAKRALAIDHAGLSIFATAISMASSQSREIAVLSLGDNQSARLALFLRAAGLSQSAVEEQFLYLHPEVSLPDAFDALSSDRATALLADASQGLAN